MALINFIVATVNLELHCPAETRALHFPAPNCSATVGGPAIRFDNAVSVRADTAAPGMLVGSLAGETDTTATAGKAAKIL